MVISATCQKAYNLDSKIVDFNLHIEYEKFQIHNLSTVVSSPVWLYPWFPMGKE